MASVQPYPRARLSRAGIVVLNKACLPFMEAPVALPMRPRPDQQGFVVRIATRQPEENAQLIAAWHNI